MEAGADGFLTGNVAAAVRPAKVPFGPSSGACGRVVRDSTHARDSR